LGCGGGFAGARGSGAAGGRQRGAGFAEAGRSGTGAGRSGSGDGGFGYGFGDGFGDGGRASGDGARGGFFGSGALRPGPGGPGDGGSRAGAGRAAFGGTGFGSNGSPSAQTLRTVAYLKSHQPGSKYLLAVQGSTAAGQFVLAGVSVLPMGGFTGSVPFPTPSQLATLVSTGQVRYVLTGGGFGGFGGRTQSGSNASLIQTWVTAHCTPVNPSAYGGTAATTGRSQGMYSCASAEAH
jgi:hypothetical protein